MLVISADGKGWLLLIILPETMQKVSTRHDGTTEILQDYLPANSVVVHCSPASLDKDIFRQWVDLLVRCVKLFFIVMPDKPLVMRTEQSLFKLIFVYSSYNSAISAVLWNLKTVDAPLVITNTRFDFLKA